jgi:hypothetical protein
MAEIPRQYSLVRFSYEDIPEEYHSGYPFIPDRLYIFLGEIPNMPGHCIVIDHGDGTVHSGYHIENFSEISEEE